MSGPHDPRPWWASTPGDVDDDADPVTRHRQARAGTGGDRTAEAPGDGAGHDEATRTGPRTAPIPSWWEPAAEAVARLSEDLASTATANADAARGRASWEDEGQPADGPAGDPRGWPSSRRAAGGGAASAHDEPGPRPPRDGGTAEADAAAHLDVCGVCPICVGLRALGTHRPELVGHLAEAARHLAAAVRSVVEAGTEPPRRQPHAAADDGLTRIDLDDLGGHDGAPEEPGRG